MNYLKRYWLISIPIASIISVAWFYANHFGTHVLPHVGTGEKEYNAYATFGQFGDFFGGLLNPILAFLNIALIVYYQQNSVAKTGERDVIFRMMQMQRDIVKEFSLKSGDMSSDGLRAFWVFDDEIKKKYKAGGLDRSHSPQQKLSALIAAYESVYHEDYRKQYLGHYFRHLYHIYKLIEGSETFSAAEKLHYAKIVRAQLSHLELKLLFLNCCSADGAAFRRYVGLYNLLEWFDDEEFDNFDTEFKSSSVIKETIDGWRNESAG